MRESDARVDEKRQPRFRAGKAPKPRAAWLRALDRPYVLAFCLAAATLVVYLRAIAHGFVHLDDPEYVTDNQHVLTGLSFQNVKWCFTSCYGGNWFPLTWLSLMLDSQFFDARAPGFHFTNVILHAANTVLLFALLTQATRSMGKSAFVAALFALHPLHVESVAWVSERKDVLSVFFGLLSLLAYVRFASRRSRASGAACLLLFVCSLMSKQTLVTLPFLLLLFDYWPLNRLSEKGSDKTGAPSLARLVAEKLPFLVVSAVFCVIAVFAQGTGVGTLKEYPLSTRCLNALVAYVIYLRQTVWPSDLAAFYPYPASIPIWAGIGAAALLLSVSAAALLWIRKLPFFFVGWAWYLGTLIPLIGIVQIGGQKMADRYTYFPLIGIFLAVTWLAAHVMRNVAARDNVLAVAGGAVLALLSATTFVQIGYWGDSVALYQRCLDFAPGDPDITSWLGVLLVDRGEDEQGLRLLETASRTPPPSAKIEFAYAFALQKLGRLDDAAAKYRRTLALDDSDAQAHSNLAVILSSQNQFAAARQQLERAIQVDPTYVKAYVNLGVVSMALGQYADAITFSQRALQIDPSLLTCHSTIALALRAQGRFDEAINQFRYLVQASPGDERLRLELARTQAMKRQSPSP